MSIIKLILSPLLEARNILIRIIIFWPSTRIGNKFRNLYYNSIAYEIGLDCNFESGVRLSDAKKITIGSNNIFGRNVHLNAGECKGIYVGNYVAIADGTYIRSSNHNFDRKDTPILSQGHSYKEICFQEKIYSVVIENDVWIGARCIILSGAHIGEGSVISAGSIVSSKIPANSIVAGNPARVIGKRIN